MKYAKLETGRLRDFDCDEKWLQNKIAASPEILGLGNLKLIERERIQQGGGRLDFLFQGKNGKHYEVEIQRGEANPSHIIRTIQYWLKERQRNPKYKHNHCAVIVAENVVTSRFFDVIWSFNNEFNIPIIAIQVTAVKITEAKTGLIFTRVLDEIKQICDENSWRAKKDGENKVSIIKEIHETFSAKYKFSKKLHWTQEHVNFVTPENKKIKRIVIDNRDNGITLRFRIPKQTDDNELNEELNKKDTLSYSSSSSRKHYLFKIRDIPTLRDKKNILEKLFRLRFKDGA